MTDTNQSLRVLVIDDDPDVRRVLKGMLKALGHEPTSADDGLAGLEAFRSGQFDVVITDIMMPGQAGLETIGELRRHDPDVRVIAISGGGRIQGSEDVLMQAANLGAQATLGKPFQVSDLKHALFGVVEFG